MIKHLFVGLLMISTIKVWAQAPAISLQANLSIQYQLEGDNPIQLFGPSASILFHKANGSKHQLEWSNIRFASITTDLASSNSFYNAFRYEISRKLAGDEGKVVWQMGLSTTWSQYSFRSDPLTADRFTEKEIGTGFTFHLVPAAIIPLTDKIYLEVGIPLQLVSMDMNLSRTQDPSMPTQSGIDILEFTQNFGGGFMFRSGIGINL
ncbi:MAG: hypothetical protein AAFN10_00315 [Bacteroidota bacterium]